MAFKLIHLKLAELPKALQSWTKHFAYCTGNPMNTEWEGLGSHR